LPPLNRQVIPHSKKAVLEFLNTHYNLWWDLEFEFPGYESWGDY